MKHIVIVALMLAGCASVPGAPQRPTDTVPPVEPAAGTKMLPPARHNLTGYSPAFRQGYADGCEGGLRDEARMKTDTDYAMGWNDGRGMCARRPGSR